MVAVVLRSATAQAILEHLRPGRPLLTRLDGQAPDPRGGGTPRGHDLTADAQK